MTINISAAVYVFDFVHLQNTFTDAERLHPDLMEPYTTRLGDAETEAEKTEIMRGGLRETFRRRYPMPTGCEWPEVNRGFPT
jgi:hypothetical protein